MAQMRSYMYQLVEQLNWALSAIDKVQTENASQTTLSASQAVDSEEKAQSTFNQIKSLIIKSADIVEAYYDSMKHQLDGSYVAISDFGTFQENTSQAIEANSTSITQIFSDIQSIESNVSAIEEMIIESDSWIRKGLLDYDENGVPIYGIEVGQKSVIDGEEVFNKYARFTAGGIYFYLPGIDEPVAYITDSQLYITEANIIYRISIGNFAFIPRANGNLSFKKVR